MRAASDIRPADHPIGDFLDAEIELLTAVVTQARRDGDADFLALVQTHLEQSGCPATATFQALNDRADAAAALDAQRPLSELAAQQRAQEERERQEALKDSLSRGVRQVAEQATWNQPARKKRARRQVAAKQTAQQPEKELVCKNLGVKLTESDYRLFQQVCATNGRGQAVQMRLWLHEEAERLGLD